MRIARSVAVSVLLLLSVEEVDDLNNKQHTKIIFGKEHVENTKARTIIQFNLYIIACIDSPIIDFYFPNMSESLYICNF